MKKIINVVFLWKPERKIKSFFRKNLSGIKNMRLIFPSDLSEANLMKLSENAHVYIGWRPSAQLLENSHKLIALINPGTGIKHHIPVFRELNKKRKVLLINSHGHAYSTAQHTVAMLLDFTNKISLHHKKMEEGRWRTSDEKDIFSSSIRLKNKNIGLLGYGAINKYVHKFLSGYENQFHIFKLTEDKSKSDGKNNIKFYSKIRFNEFLKNTDILIIAVPHTKLTEGMIGMKELKLLGKEAIVINVARGIIIDEKSLYTALKNKIISGAAIDVWYNYRPKKDKAGREYPYKYPFHKLDNVLLSPHRAASPFDDTERLEDIIENIKRISAGRSDLINVVDLQREY